MKSRRMLTSANILIAIVAIIECFILFSFTTYSWIESSSSLIISTGENGGTLDESMDVSSNINYQVNLAADAAVPADMTTFYRTVKYFRFAKASSADGKTFYFPKTNATNTANSSNGYTAVSGYRAGDTADYNISYTYFDFSLVNTSNIKKEFYFVDGSPTTLFTAEGSTVDGVNAAVENAMRISFQQDDAAPKIYAKSASSYNGVRNTSGTTSSVTPIAISTAVYDEEDTTGANKIFEANIDGSESTVAVRIWLEEKALTAAALEHLDEVTVSVNLKLVSDNIVYDQIYFDDYSYSTETAHAGSHSTETGSQMYLYAFNSSSSINRYMAYPMSLTTNEDDPSIPRWVTSAPVEYVFNNLTNASSSYFTNAFFGYGNIEDPTHPIYKWSIPSALSVDREDNKYANLTEGYDHIIALGVSRSKATYSSGEAVQGYSVLSSVASVEPTLVYFRDDVTGLTGTNNYNVNTETAKNFRFITDSLSTSDTYTNVNMYVTGASGAAATASVGMYYDSANELYMAYVPASWINNNTLYFKYCKAGYYTTSNTILWHPTTHGSSVVYTGLGYNGSTLVGSMNASSNLTGIGTWDDVREISFSTELIDSTISASNVYRASFDNSNYYLMYPDASKLVFTAYVPVDSSAVYFKRNSDRVWNAGAITSAEETYYPVSNSAGYFHISVLVDGTWDNLINNTLSDNASATLTAVTSDGGSTIDLESATYKLDNYRWYVPCTADTASVTYTWTPYPATSTTFTYSHYLDDGIYYVVTE